MNDGLTRERYSFFGEPQTAPEEPMPSPVWAADERATDAHAAASQRVEATLVSPQPPQAMPRGRARRRPVATLSKTSGGDDSDGDGDHSKSANKRAAAKIAAGIDPRLPSRKHPGDPAFWKSLQHAYQFESPERQQNWLIADRKRVFDPELLTDEARRDLNPSDFVDRKPEPTSEFGWIVDQDVIPVGARARTFNEEDTAQFQAYVAAQENQGDDFDESDGASESEPDDEFVRHGATVWEQTLAVCLPSGSVVSWDETEWGPAPFDVDTLTADQKLAHVGKLLGKPLDSQRFNVLGQKNGRQAVDLGPVDDLGLDLDEINDLLREYGRTRADLEEVIARRSHELSVEAHAKAITPPPKKSRSSSRHAR